jgi:hypothetical protein
MKNSNRNSGKWLILAYFFNADGKAASQTITDRIPYLIAEGIQPVVISAPLGLKDRRFPHFRVFSLFPSGFRYELRYLLKNKEKSSGSWRVLKTVSSVLLLPFYLLERLVVHLETHWSWGISAAFRGIFLIFRFHPEIIYTTAGPATTHMAGYILHRLSGLPWIAELHDPLVYDAAKQKRNQRYLFNNWLEKVICRHAAAVIYFTEHALASADRRHRIAGKKVVLRPGADPPDTPGVEYSQRERMYFGYFGSLSGGRNLSLVMQAFHDLFREEPALQQLISLNIYGADLDGVSGKAQASFPLGTALTLHGRLEYDPVSGKSGRQQVVEAMKKSDVLLILHGRDFVCREYIPSKVYEYLLTGRPILGLTAETTELGRMLRECGHRLADPDDVDSMKKAFRECISTWQEKGLEGTGMNSPYTIERTVRNLLDVVEQVK